MTGLTPKVGCKFRCRIPIAARRNGSSPRKSDNSVRGTARPLRTVFWKATITGCLVIAMSAELIDEKAVFNLARRIELREARADYLQQVCGDNPQALARVVALLEVHDREHSFLE